SARRRIGDGGRSSTSGSITTRSHTTRISSTSSASSRLEAWTNTMTDGTNNPRRGCGYLVPGGCYLRGSGFSKDGTLQPLVWVLGTHVLNDKNLLKTIPPRGQYLFDPELSLEREIVLMAEEADVIRRDLSYTGSQFRQIAACGSRGIIDHVGSSHYTAWSFAQELAHLGPSRKVDPDIARWAAPRLPMRIFFTHGKVPFFLDPDHREAFMRQVMEWNTEALRSTFYAPTWYDPTWSWRIKYSSQDGSRIENYGADHYMVDVMRFLNGG